MHEFTVAMGLMDFVPVAFFGGTVVLLLQDLYNKMGKGTYGLLAAGCINVVASGFLKALWKLLYAAGICDFVALEQMFLPVNSLGLLLTGLSLVGMLCHWKTVTRSAAPVVITGSLPFIAMMVVGLGAMCAVLSILAARLKRAPAMLLFLACFLCSMGMGYLGSKDASLAWVNWAEQSVNTLSQLCLLLGVMALHRAGLKDWRP